MSGISTLNGMTQLTINGRNRSGFVDHRHYDNLSESRETHEWYV